MIFGFPFFGDAIPLTSVPVCGPQRAWPSIQGGKHAAVGFTKATALDYAKHDITVNAICPSVYKTAIFDEISDEQMSVYNGMVPRGRVGDPIEVAWLALFLASDMARNINGTAIPIDSGFLAGDQNTATEWILKDTREQ